MPRAADFADAHLRHWEDAESLFALDRWANADHLYGLSAECGLKAVMQALGMQVDVEGTPIMGKHRMHVDKLWPTYIDFVEGQREWHYVLRGAPFADWSINDRYANRNHFTQPNVEPHRDAAGQVHDIVKYLNTGGLP